MVFRHTWKTQVKGIGESGSFLRSSFLWNLRNGFLIPCSTNFRPLLRILRLLFPLESKEGELDMRIIRSGFPTDSTGGLESDVSSSMAMEILTKTSFYG